MNKIYIDDEFKKKFGSLDSLNDLALKIKEQIKDDDVLFIYINLKFGKNTRVSKSGIELLIWLRLYEVMNHCILYSFETIFTILNNQPKHLIATSIGTSFVQLPIDLNKIDLIELKKKKAETKNIKTCLSIAFDKNELKHHLANLYGLWFLFNTHNDHFPNEKLDYSIFPDEFYRNFNNLQLSIARFLFQIDFHPNSSVNIINKINVLRENIRIKQPKILYIDDKANLGWGSLIRKILLQDDDRSHFDIINPSLKDFETDQSFYELAKNVKERIYNEGNYIDCMFLDLRLADEEGEIINIDNLSGIKLLDTIHKTFPYLPIIITTASDKAETVKKIYEFGADALWTKPGLDSIHDENKYLKEYFELLKYTETALNKYSNVTEKHIVKAQFQLSKPRHFERIPNQLKDIDIILTDTMFWCETGSRLVENHIVIYNLAKIFKLNKKRFILIDDVLNELFIKSQKTGKEKIGKVGLRSSATFSIKLIQQYKNERLIESSFKEVMNAIKKSTDYIKQQLEGGGYHIISSDTKVHSYHPTEETADKELEKRKEDGHFSLHADDTFKLLITYFLNQKKNVLFVSNDRKCKIEILNSFRHMAEEPNANWEIPNSFDINKGILTIQSNNLSFCMMVPTDILYKICYSKVEDRIEELVLPIPITR